MISLKGAAQRVGLAGRGLGSGPLLAVKRLVDIDAVEALFPTISDRELDLLASGTDPDLRKTLQTKMAEARRLRAEIVAYGIAIGLVMAEASETIEELRRINAEWLEEKDT
jgi:hypothetical protein